MPTNDLQLIPMNAVSAGIDAGTAQWLWNGVIHPGDVTLLTSQWKTGKTTTLCGLLQQLGDGRPFLGRDTRPAKAWVVSEESPSVWADRLALLPVGAHTQLLARPFRGRPTVEQWHQLIERAADARAANELDLLVVDPLASFLPGRCESDAATLLEALHPLHRLTDRGAAVLLLHHPKKGKSEAGSSARGSGALLGFVDTSVELTRYSRWKADENRRLMRVESRRGGTPDRLAFEWDPRSGAFAVLVDPRERLFAEHWGRVRDVLSGRQGAISPREIREYWPADVDCPSLSRLYDWLAQAHARQLVRREGGGTNRAPWRYRLASARDDAGELPPLEPL